jgi:hypothetical protein
MSELNSKINNIISQVAKSLPEGTQIEFTQECLDGIEKSLKEPRKSFEEQIKDVCNETIIDKTIEIENDHDEPMKMTVKVHKANYGKYLYYRIIVDKPCKNEFDSHPFSQVFKLLGSELEESKLEIGEVVADNEMMRNMFNYLAMEDEDLEDHTGNTSCMKYRSAIIKTITLLWD